MSYGEYLGGGSGTTKLLLHLNGSSADSSGNGNNGIDANISYSLTNGRFGQGAGFDGITSNILTSSNLGITGSSARTYSFWIKPTSLAGTYYLLDTGIATGTNRFLIYIHSSGKVAVNTWEAQDMTTDNVVLSTSSWSNVVITYAGADSLNTTSTKIYINGNQVPTNNPTTSTLNTTNSQLYIGASILFTNFTPTALEEIAIENRAWSAEEVKRRYTYQKGFYN